MTFELVLAAAFAAGFIGSSHCAGMCGPIVAVFEAPADDLSSMHPGMRRMLYNGGRALTYTLLGSFAGLTGTLLTAGVGAGYAGLLLRSLAAFMVALLGLRLMGGPGLPSLFDAPGARIWAALAPLGRRLLPISSPTRALGAGLLWGLLPCGLLYSAVALAATSGSATGGALTMAGFWLGTMPTLLLAGTLAHRLRAWRSNPVRRRLAGALLLAGALVAFALPFSASDHDHPGAHEADEAAHPTT